MVMDIGSERSKRITRSSERKAGDESIVTEVLGRA
jgi:hypothetical protein